MGSQMGQVNVMGPSLKHYMFTLNLFYVLQSMLAEKLSCRLNY